MRYRAFLLYCEQRRQESRIQQEEDEGRKRRAKAREEHCELLRQSMEYIKKNESKWKTRKIEGCERRGKERQASNSPREKEEIRNKELEQRGNQETEDADRGKARDSPGQRELLKLYREGGKTRKMNKDEERRAAWQRLEEEISALEGESS